VKGLIQVIVSYEDGWEDDSCSLASAAAVLAAAMGIIVKYRIADDRIVMVLLATHSL
jgi:hypothetical protein